MISLNMPKSSMNEQVNAWLEAGNKIKQLSGFENKLHKPVLIPANKGKKQEKLPPLSQSNASKLHHWLIAEKGRLALLSNYLGVSSTTISMIRDQKLPCPPSKWRNIVKFMESYK